MCDTSEDCVCFAIAIALSLAASSIRASSLSIMNKKTPVLALMQGQVFETCGTTLIAGCLKQPTTFVRVPSHPSPCNVSTRQKLLRLSAVHPALCGPFYRPAFRPHFHHRRLSVRALTVLFPHLRFCFCLLKHEISYLSIPIFSFCACVRVFVRIGEIQRFFCSTSRSHARFSPSPINTARESSIGSMPVMV